MLLFSNGNLTVTLKPLSKIYRFDSLVNQFIIRELNYISLMLIWYVRLAEQNGHFIAIRDFANAKGFQKDVIHSVGQGLIQKRIASELMQRTAVQYDCKCRL
jgi:spore maturation protein CgeB